MEPSVATTPFLTCFSARTIILIWAHARGGMAAYDPSIGLQREIHNIENSPFRTKFEDIFDEMQGTSAIGCISDTDPQPLLIRSNLGTYAICIIGIINNADALIEQYLTFSSGHFDAMTGGKVNSTRAGGGHD